MTEHIRALIVISILAIPSFIFFRQSIDGLIPSTSFYLRRNLWFCLTISAFLAGNFWIYTIIAGLLLTISARKEANKIALFFFLLFALPVAATRIPGLNLINYIFELSHVRILSLFVLLPTFFYLSRRNDTLTLFWTSADKILAIYLLVNAILYLRDTSLTDTFRQLFYLFIDIFLPYFVISRSLKDLQAFRDAIHSFVLAVMLLASLAIFEFIKHWLLYYSLLGALNLEGTTGYLIREDFVRPIVTTGQPIVLGYLMAVGVGFYLYTQSLIQKKYIRQLGIFLLIAGLLAPLSRGPWVGAFILLIVFIATGRFASRRLFIFSVATLFTFNLIALLPSGDRVINLLPYIGKTEKANIEFRENLIENSLIVIQRNPWFGSANYLENPEMEALRQGSLGIIDVVNTYIGIALKTGVVGLMLFIGFFTLVIIGVFRAMQTLPNRDSEEYLLGRSLLATLIAILIIIGTVSSITIIPAVYWSVAGLGVAYVQLIRKQTRIDVHR